MKKIIRILREADLFIIFITRNSLDSKFVREELEEAIRLTKQGKIREICPIILDSGIDAHLNNRIPQFIKACDILYATAAINAAQMVEKLHSQIPGVI